MVGQATITAVKLGNKLLPAEFFKSNTLYQYSSMSPTFLKVWSKSPRSFHSVSRACKLTICCTTGNLSTTGIRVLIDNAWGVKTLSSIS